VEVLAIVPARGGSKGLPNKNILPLSGHPLIAYSIKAGLDAQLVTRVLVSTDSETIASVSRSYGAEVPFLRPAELAGDLSRDLEVFQHALHWLDEHEGYRPDLVIQLRPTSPVRPAGLIDEAIRKLSDSDADSLRIVTPSPITPYKMWFADDENDIMRPLLTLNDIPEPFNEPRQNLPQTYWQIGTLDVIRPQVITEQNSMSGKRILPFIVGNELAVDIDDIQSFRKAEDVIAGGNYVRFE
jgi:CMP-N,N'-diacetyllegionaminic acid synthase